jgi:hypothetical protein
MMIRIDDVDDDEPRPRPSKSCCEPRRAERAATVQQLQSAAFSTLPIREKKGLAI